VLDDGDPAERVQGMEAGWAWGAWANWIAVYTDLGISLGMDSGIAMALRIGVMVRYRELGGEWAGL